MMSMSLRCLLLLAAPIVCVATRIPAQSVQGTVRDRTSNQALAGVVITLTHTGSKKEVATQSDSAGVFAFKLLKPGPFVLAIDRDGRAYTHDFDLVATERLQLYIHVPTDTSALAVSGTSSRVRKLELNGFYDRYQKGRGQFITREEIEKRGVRSLPDLLATVRGVRIEWGARGGDAILRQGGGGAGALSGGGVCRPSIYVDGVLIRPGGNQEPQLVLEQVDTPDHVQAVEVYTGAAQLPTAYSDLQSACGVILIWTR
jgi:hypothetical protein